MNLKGRNFLTLKDFTPEEILYLLDLSAELKAKKKAGELTEYYKGKNIALIFILPLNLPDNKDHEPALRHRPYYMYFCQ